MKQLTAAVHLHLLCCVSEQTFCFQSHTVRDFFPRETITGNVWVFIANANMTDNNLFFFP